MYERLSRVVAASSPQRGLSSPRAQLGSPLQRRGAFVWQVLLPLVVVGGAVGWMAYQRVVSGETKGPAVGELMAHVVKMEPFTLTVVDRGELTSSSNVEVRCDVKSRNTTGTAIIEIVPEGTNVKAGDVICRLDSSALQLEATQQEIVVNTSESLMIQAKNAVDLALIAKEQYLNGEYKQLEQTAQAEILVAEENQRRSEQVVQFSERMASRGYSSQIQLEADRFALEKALTDLKVAETKLEVLSTFTRKKMLTQLESDIKTGEAKFRAAEATYNLDAQKLKEIREQVALCTILAPQDGQVVYASSQGFRDENEAAIKEGTLVRERQVIARLPDPKKMQVEAQINESRVALLKAGMSAYVRVDAFPDVRLLGKVVKVNEFPEPERWNSTNKRYMTKVELLDQLPGIRPGLTAQVEIVVSEEPAALLVPVQAVVQHAGKHYCVVKDGDAVVAKPVTVGNSNEKQVVVMEGLKENQVVAVNSRKFWQVAARAAGIDLSIEQKGEGETGLARRGRPGGRPGGPGGPGGPSGAGGAGGAPGGGVAQRGPATAVPAGPGAAPSATGASGAVATVAKDAVPVGNPGAAAGSVTAPAGAKPTSAAAQ